VEILTVQEVEFLAFRLAREHLSFDEPIPDFSTRFPNVLESCLVTPFMKFEGKFLYPSLAARGSILFYLLIKNHPFQNGNKRIAITTLLLFLSKYKKWLIVDAQKFYNFTVWVAQSQAEFKDEVVTAIEKFIKNHLVKLEAKN
jgi:death-on-curing protein